jgi:hypothetical protein
MVGEYGMEQESCFGQRVAVGRRCSGVGLGDSRMARGIHGLPKVSPKLTMPNLFTPCGRAIPQTALQLFWGWPAAVFFPLGYPTPYGPGQRNREKRVAPNDGPGEDNRGNK